MEEHNGLEQRPAPLRMYAAEPVDAYIHALEERVRRLETERPSWRAVTSAGRHADDQGDTDSLVGRALLLAQRTADETVASATREATELLRRARSDADRLLAEAHRQCEAILEAARAEVVRGPDAPTPEGSVVDLDDPAELVLSTFDPKPAQLAAGPPVGRGEDWITGGDGPMPPPPPGARWPTGDGAAAVKR